MVTPKFLDDWWYMAAFKDWFDSQGVWFPTDGGNPFRAGVPWRGFFDTIAYHYWNDNVRLSNITGAFVLLFPKWLGSCLALGGWVAGMLYSLRFIGIDIHKSRLVPVALFLWCFMMPWKESMGCLVYQFNYLVPSGIYMFLLVKAWNVEYQDNNTWLLGLIGIIAGAWHETFAFPAVVGAVTVTVLFKKFRTRRYIIIFSGMCLGMMWLLLCPGIYVRLDYTDNLNFSLGYMADQFSHHPGGFIAVITLILFIVKEGWSRFIADSRLVFMISSAVASFVLAVFTTGSARAAWWCDMMSVVAILYMLDILYSKSDVRRTAGVVVDVFLLIPVFVTLLFADYNAVRVHREYRRVIQEYISNPERAVFSDVLARHPLPLVYWPMATTFGGAYYMFTSSYFKDYNGCKNVELKIVPEALRESREDEDAIIAGDVGLRTRDNVMYMRSDSTDIYTFISKVDFGRGGKVSWAYTTAVPYVSEADGKSYVHIDVWSFDIRHHIGRIIRVDYNREINR